MMKIIEKINKLMNLPLIFMVIGGIFLIYIRSIDDPLQRGFMFLVALSVLIPAAISIFTFIASNIANIGINSCRQGENKEGNEDKVDTRHLATEKQLEKHRVKIIRKEESKTKGKVADKPKSKVITKKEYVQLRNAITNFSKEKSFTRKDILKIKFKINSMLDDHLVNYSKMSFENDLHEIYVKIKSSKFSEPEWIVLRDYVSDLVFNRKDLKELKDELKEEEIG